MRWGVGVRVCVTAVDVLLTVMGAIEYCARAVFVWMPLCVLRACECVSEAEGRWSRVVKSGTFGAEPKSVTSLLVRSCPIVRSRSPAPSALARTTARPGLARALRKVGPDSLTTMHAHTADVELVALAVLVDHVADAGQPWGGKRWSRQRAQRARPTSPTSSSRARSRGTKAGRLASWPRPAPRPRRRARLPPWRPLLPTAVSYA